MKGLKQLPYFFNIYEKSEIERKHDWLLSAIIFQYVLQN